MQEDIHHDRPGPRVSRVPPSRVSQACARCRQQKLKCDTAKPCTMCLRSGKECRPRIVPKVSSTRRQSMSSAHGVGRQSGAERARRQSHHSLTSPSVTEWSASVQTATDAVTLRNGSASQFGANRSAISLAMNMYKSLGTRDTKLDATIPGDSSPGSQSLGGPRWTLQTMQMPPAPVILTLMDVYFDKTHWFIWIFHKPSFVERAKELMTSDSWRREDMTKVLVTLAVAAVGLKCAHQDMSTRGQKLLHSISPDPHKLLDQLIGEVKFHLLDLLDVNCIETVQVCLLLGAFYMFHGSASLAWATIGLSVRTSYALALHCAPDSEDPIDAQVRRRCWNHLTVADTFASQIYGRPANLDPAFSELLPLADIDDTVMHISGDLAPEGSITAVTFHWLKYNLYGIIMETVSTFRLLRLHNPITIGELQSLIEAVDRIDTLLARWREQLPPVLDSDELSSGSTPEEEPDLESYDDPDDDRRRLRLQACLLQVIYNAAIILAHRPLLEFRLSADYRHGVPRRIAERVSRSFDVCVKAALRVSSTPIMQFRNEFCMAFIFVHLFTSGVILCIPPATHPYSTTAQDAKSGVFRIIQAAKALSQHSQIARHTEMLLGDLLKLSLHREVDMAFKDERKAETQPSHPWSQEATPASQNIDVVPDARVPDHQGPYSSNERADPTLTNSESAMGDEWMEESLVNFANADSSGMHPLDLPLDETFSAFGQAMFNLLPDDLLNVWGWGDGSI